MLVEAALITPLLLFLLFAVIEWGYTMHDRLSVDNMTLTGARTGSGQGNKPLADYYILQSLGKRLGAVSRSEIKSIVVYKASGPNSAIPAGCKSSSVAGSCNRYNSGDLSKAASQFGCVGPPGPATKVDSSWCPTTRKTARTGTYGPPDHIGVYVEVDHEHFTALFGSSTTLTSNTIIRVEPRTNL